MKIPENERRKRGLQQECKRTPIPCGGGSAKLFTARIISLILALLLPFLIAQPGEWTAGADNVTAIVGATLIDGNGGPAVPDAIVIVTGNRITEVGPCASIKIPASALIIDGKGKFVTPGFIDTNVHLSLYDGEETFARYEQQHADLVLEAAQLSLKYGITTVMDSYGSLLPLAQVRDAINRGEYFGPRILVAGNVVGWGGPYSITFSQIPNTNLTIFQEHINDFITQGAGQELYDMSPEELRGAINRYIDRGPDFIKYGGTAHFEYPTLIAFSPDQQKVLVEEAHKRGKIVETHATSSESLRICVLAGIDLIQHPEILSETYPDDLIKMIRDRKIICSILSNAFAEKVFSKHLNNNEEREKDNIEAKMGTTGQVEKVQRAKSPEELQKERYNKRFSIESRKINAQKLIQSGCLVTPSSDNYLGMAPEFRREQKTEDGEAGIGSIIAIEGLVALGMTPSQALVAATKNGAIACHCLNEFGTLEVGKLADLLIFNADPLADISNIRKLAVVMCDGQIIDCSKLPEKPVWHGHSDGILRGKSKS